MKRILVPLLALVLVTAASAGRLLNFQDPDYDVAVDIFQALSANIADCDLYIDDYKSWNNSAFMCGAVTSGGFDAERRIAQAIFTTLINTHGYLRPNRCIGEHFEQCFSTTNNDLTSIHTVLSDRTLGVWIVPTGFKERYGVVVIVSEEP